ncbi:MAG: efflux RND transporter permease subunit [Caldilineaceae bacterium]|nr:efflux RND transporter permease subunit [Caldilineaceae bacterium]
MKIWNLSIKQPVFMTMILTAGIVLGLLAYTRMPVNLFPDVEFPVIVVNTVYPGASPEEVEEQITARLEDELSTTSGLESIQSTSAEAVSTIILQFDLNLSVDKVSQDVREKVNLLRNQLPSGVQDPIIQTFDPTNLPILSFSVADQTGQLSPSELRKLVEEEIQAPLERIPNVSAVDVSGGQVREIQVNLNMQAMQALRIAPQQVTGALQSANINMPGGTVEDNGQELLVRTPANLQTLADIGNIIISQRTAPIYLHDIATVTDGFEKQDRFTRLNGEDAIVFSIRKTSGSNTVTVAHDVKNELETLTTSHPNLNVVITSDQSIQVEESTDGAVEDLLFAAILAAVVMLFFFRDLRNTLVTVAGLPVIMISTLFFMDLFGISLNQISLLALALVVGLVIDDGIVVRENILRWVEKGFSPRVAASLGTAEVGLPVVAIGATILAVFLPVAFAQGIIGKFFLDFGLTVSIAMVISVFEAVTMAPMLSAYIFKKQPGAIDVELDELDQIEERGFAIAEEWEDHAHNNSWLNRIYGKMIGWTLHNKLLAILIAVVIIAASFSSIVFIELSFLPATSTQEFTVAMSLPGGTPLRTTLQEAVQIENILRQHPSIADIVTTVGGTGAPEEATFMVSLRDDLPNTITAKSVINELRGPLATVPGIIFSTASGGLGSSASDVAVDVIGVDGTDYNALGAEAQRLAAQLAQDPNLADIDVSYRPGRPEIQISIDRQRAADLGLDVIQIAATMRLLVNGDVATTFRGEGDEADIRVQLDQGSHFGQDEILNISLLSATGNLVPLRNVAQLNVATSPNAISRIDRQPSISVSANVIGDKSVPSATAEIVQLINSWQMPTGMEVRLGGDAADQEEALGSMLLALLLGVIFVYMVLASQFGSFIQPLIIMLAMPLAIAGAIIALLVAGRSLDMTAIIGFIMLMGLVVKNSVLLVDFANRARRKGASADEAMLIAGPVRLRPILMTSLAMILAMIPITLGLSAGGEFRQPMAIAIMGGMITSTLLTLLVVPLAYGVVVGFQDRQSARRKRRQAQKEQAQKEIEQQKKSKQLQPEGKPLADSEAI